MGKSFKFVLGVGMAGSLALLMVGVVPKAARAEPPVSVTVALPAPSFLFTPFYVAADRGFFRENGIEPKAVYVAGPGVIPAVLGRSADYALIFGGIQLSAASRNQRLVGIANTQDRFTTDLVVRKVVADRFQTVPATDPLARVRAMKGLTVGVDSINGLPHAYLRFLARKAGMNPETDFTVTPLQPQAMVAAIKNGTIDAMAFSPPFTLAAVNDGAVTWVSGPELSLPELRNFPYNLVATRPDYCPAQPERCRGFVAALRKGAAFMTSDPAGTAEIMGKIFDKLSADTVRSSVAVFAGAVSTDMAIKDGMYANVVGFDRTSGILPEGAAVPPEAELFSDAWAR